MSNDRFTTNPESDPGELTMERVVGFLNNNIELINIIFDGIGPDGETGCRIFLETDVFIYLDGADAMIIQSGGNLQSELNRDPGLDEEGLFDDD